MVSSLFDLVGWSSQLLMTALNIVYNNNNNLSIFKITLSLVEGATPPGKYRITLALVRALRRIPHLIRAILRFPNGMYRSFIAFAVYSNSQATMDIMLPIPGLDKPLSGQSHNLLI